MLTSYGLDMETIERKLRYMKNGVKLIYFTRETHCIHCMEAGRLYESLASLTHKIQFETVNFAIDVDKDKEFHIFAIPALAVLSLKDYGIRYYGHPQGQELNHFLDDLVYISRGLNSLPEEVNKRLASLNRKVNLKIFISPICPYSLPAAKLGIKLAVACDNVSVDIINATEFIEAARRNNVLGIPMTVVDENESFYGALEPVEYVEAVLKRVVKEK